MFQGSDYLKMHTEYVLNSIKQAQEIQSASMKLDEANSELRRMKIDILKNGTRKDKINLLIQERIYVESIEKQIESLKRKE